MTEKKPNILVIWGDDIGISNLSCYSDGLMGYRTPHIDRIADEGMRFTDSYGQQSCTAGRQRGNDLHRLLRRAELYCRESCFHHRTERLPYRVEQGGNARSQSRNSA